MSLFFKGKSLRKFIVSYEDICHLLEYLDFGDVANIKNITYRQIVEMSGKPNSWFDDEDGGYLIETNAMGDVPIYLLQLNCIELTN